MKRAKIESGKAFAAIVAEDLRDMVIPAAVLEAWRGRNRTHCHRRQLELAMQPVLHEWLEQHQGRAVQLSEEELDELFSLFGTGGPLTLEGVEYFVAQIERKRNVKSLLGEIMDTDLADAVETMVNALHVSCQPYRGR